MSRNTKIVLLVVGGLLALCCMVTVAVLVIVPMFVASVAGDAVVEEGEAGDVGQEIVDYELPPGYKEEGGMQVLGMKMVFITPEGGGDEQMIALMQLPAGIPLDEETMRQQMQEAVGQQAGKQGNVPFTVMATEEAVINGKPAVLTTMEGADENGNSMRQVFGIFEAKNGGGAMVMVMGNVESWNETAVNQFLTSIRDDAE